MRSYIKMLSAVVLGALLLPCYLSAQTSQPKTVPSENLPPDAPTPDQVMTLLDQLQVRRNFNLMMDGMKQSMEEGAVQALRRKNPNPTPKQIAAIKSFTDEIFSAFQADEVINAVVPVYQRHLKKSDLEELIRFYGSPVGQKIIREQPQILQESMQAGQDIAKRHMDEVLAKVEERVKEMADDNEPAPAAKP